VTGIKADANDESMADAKEKEFSVGGNRVRVCIEQARTTLYYKKHK
jgi:hypothetical protein